MTLYCFQDKKEYKPWQEHIVSVTDSLDATDPIFLTISTQETKIVRKRWSEALCIGIYEVNDHRDSVDAWISLSWSWPQIEKVIQKAKNKFSEKRQRQLFLKDLLTQEQELEDRKKEIEVDFNTHKNQKQRTASNIKRLDQFFSSVEKCGNLDELFLILTKELKKEDPAIELFLWINEPEKNSRLFWQERKKLKTTWTVYCEDEKEIHVALAQTLGRPVRKIICAPVKISEMESYFIFECDKNLEIEKKLTNNIAQYGNVIAPIIEHFVLTKKRALMVNEWQTVFNCLNDGLVLLNEDNQIIAANYKYQTLDDSRKKHLKKTVYPVSSVARLEVYQDQERILDIKAQMAQKEKMVQLGEIATDLAHELNNPLTGIKGACQVLLAGNDLEEQEREDMREIMSAVDRSHEIMRNLLEFAAEEVLPTEIVSLKDLLKSTIRLLKMALHEHSLQIEMPPSDCYVRAQPQLLQQVLFNLLINACQALDKRGKLKVWIEKKNKNIYLYVKDNGPGISMEALKKVFEPFYTTKSKGEGTGLGLSLSRDIVRRFDGDIGVVSEEGEGATFWFYLKEVDPS